MNNVINYKVINELLMKKRKKLYLIPLATYCIDLILKDFEKNIFVHQDTTIKRLEITIYIYFRIFFYFFIIPLNKRGKYFLKHNLTRFITSYSI